MEGAQVALYDPRVPEKLIHEDLIYAGVPAEVIAKQLKICSSCEDAAEHAHGVAVLTEWDEFKNTDFDKVLAGMYKPAFLFDGRNLLDHAALEKKGFSVYAIGKG